MVIVEKGDAKCSKYITKFAVRAIKLLVTAK